MTARRTRRQELLGLLESGEWSFDGLRRELGLGVAALESDLQHLERSLRGRGRRIRVEPAACHGCGFRFAGRAPRRFRAPGRCPECRSERIGGPWIRVAPS
ncbi:MAG: transcriptional regulator [Thermoanaerobaculia bacterium]|nr:transcriptional regulator [Thermoanaerobaculia bacterium]